MAAFSLVNLASMALVLALRSASFFFSASSAAFLSASALAFLAAMVFWAALAAARRLAVAALAARQPPH